jgi:hypothetical protein
LQLVEERRSVTVNDNLALSLHQDLARLEKTALRVKKERDALLTLVHRLYKELDDRYDVDKPIGEAAKEYPFSGAGQWLTDLRIALEECGVKIT